MGREILIGISYCQAVNKVEIQFKDLGYSNWGRPSLPININTVLLSRLLIIGSRRDERFSIDEQIDLDITGVVTLSEVEGEVEGKVKNCKSQ